MKRLNTIAALTLMVMGIMTGLTACNGNDPDDNKPQITITVRSCSVTEGAEYAASELKEVSI